MVNSQGNIIIPFGRYSSIDDFEDGIVFADKDGKRIAIDTGGNEVASEFEYDEALYYEGNPDYWGEEIYEDSFDSFTYYYFKDGIATLRKGDTWYVVDTLGNIIRSFQ